jgi:sugar/nucleoside kinase (ribokinase family)
MFDLITIGDSVLDTYIPLQDAIVEMSRGKKKLILRYGDKIPVGPSVTLVAGNAANNAVGSSRLQLKTAIYTNLGNDQEAQKVKDLFKKEKIDTRYLVFNSDLPSNHNIVLDYHGDRTILVYHQPWKYNLPELERTKWVYFTSLSPSFTESNIVNQLIHYLERTGARLVFNPGTYQLKDGVKKNARLLSMVHLLLVNLEEAKTILEYDRHKEMSVKRLLQEIADLGPRNVVITDGANGSYGFDGQKFYHLGVFPSKLVETTGAGDAYSTGTLAGLFYGEELKGAMRWGAANSASAVSHVGAQAGLLTYDEIKKSLKENAKVVVKEI